MSNDLKSLGMEEGLHYEGIYTTISKDGVKDAAPIGINCKADNEIGCRIFVGSQTLKNIQDTKRYVINITSNPIAFVKATVGNLDEDEFTDDEDVPLMKDAEAYIYCKVNNIEKMEPIADHVNAHGEAYLINARVDKIVKNNPCAKALNRGLCCLIESLTNFTRLDLVDENQQEYYIGRYNENKRVIDRIADNKTKEAMKLLGENMSKKGFDVE
ncbi:MULTISPECIES: DUF447 domain-containing protein [Methanobrevibacter]|jgi:hypothetical protein|uniref:DUF447 domain-containing protein n=1 Tax=Methanobrevibacter TaxID=2172 RepID=UPI0003348740|nr:MULTISPECIES: DUF447 domain-containing protein [Methanobrevibacter]AGN16528.1 hypothetical protein Abm4_0635 [Methanobrevibacter sp. AbM4]MCI6775391.1 DUF447 family protein [Methanobrevibacter boviskoreani]MDY5614619.1 DUF447 family protein [Methanobrevibacter boviskoreani]